jgi:hypothetical protein
MASDQQMFYINLIGTYFFESIIITTIRDQNSTLVSIVVINGMYIIHIHVGVDGFKISMNPTKNLNLKDSVFVSNKNF